MGNRLRDEKELPTDLDLLLLYGQFSTQDLNETFEFLRSGLSGIPGLLSLRVKRLDSIVRKLRRQPTMDIVRMDDIVGYRFIVASMTDLEASSQALMAKCSPHRIRDYRIEFHNGYRAVHMIFRRELQLPGSDGPSGTRTKCNCELTFSICGRVLRRVLGSKSRRVGVLRRSGTISTHSPARSNRSKKTPRIDSRCLLRCRIPA